MTIDPIAELSQAERKQLFDRLSYEFREGGGIARNQVWAPEETELWEAVLDALELRGKARPPLGRFVESFGRAKFREAAELANGFVLQACAAGIRRPVRMAVLRMIMVCLISHLRTRGIPATPAVMLRSLTVMPDAVDRRFPGYAGVRMLHRVAA